MAAASHGGSVLCQPATSSDYLAGCRQLIEHFFIFSSGDVARPVAPYSPPRPQLRITAAGAPDGATRGRLSGAVLVRSATPRGGSLAAARPARRGCGIASLSRVLYYGGSAAGRIIILAFGRRPSRRRRSGKNRQLKKNAKKKYRQSDRYFLKLLRCYEKGVDKSPRRSRGQIPTTTYSSINRF